MAILLGLRCTNGAVVGCDSQEPMVDRFRFWPKLAFVGDTFVTVYTGNPTLGEAFSRRLDVTIREARKEAQVDRLRASQLVEVVLLSLANEVGKNAIDERDMLVVGVADNGEICLWAVDAGQTYLREMRTWECYGSGVDAAEMLMKNFHFPEVTTKQAVALLAYVVYAVSEICADCGGPINIVVIDKGGVKQLSSEEVEARLNKVRPLLDRLTKELPKRVLKGEEVKI